MILKGVWCCTAYSEIVNSVKDWKVYNGIAYSPRSAVLVDDDCHSFSLVETWKWEYNPKIVMRIKEKM